MCPPGLNYYICLMHEFRSVDVCRSFAQSLPWRIPYFSRPLSESGSVVGNDEDGDDVKCRLSAQAASPELAVSLRISPNSPSRSANGEVIHFHVPLTI